MRDGDGNGAPSGGSASVLDGLLRPSPTDDEPQDGERPSSAAEKDALLEEREAELEAELERLRRRFEAAKERSVEATAAGDGETAGDGRRERVELELKRKDLRAALEAVRERRATLRPEVLLEEAREEATRSRRALDAALEAARDLGDAADRLLIREVATLRKAYAEAREASGRAREIRRELENEHGIAISVGEPHGLDDHLRSAAWNGVAALDALREYEASRRDVTGPKRREGEET